MARVYRFAAMIAKSADEAEDLAQSTLERAIRRLDQFDPQRGTVEAWLWRIAVNVAVDAGRGRARRLALWEWLATQQRSIGVTPDAESEAIARISDAELLAHVRRLPVRDRTVVALRYGADLDLRAVGAALGTSPAAAAAAVRRALTRLRGQLEDQK